MKRICLTLLAAFAGILILVSCSDTPPDRQDPSSIDSSDTESADPTSDDPTTPGATDVSDPGLNKPSEPTAPPADEETLTAILDRDGTDGYTGDFVLIYHPILNNSSSLYLGALNGLIDTTGDPIPISEDAYWKTTTGLYKDPDPYLTDELRQADRLYEFDDEDPWQVGFQMVFQVGDIYPDEMLFVVTAVRGRCRVWSPVNPAYGPLESVDASWPGMLADEMDRAIPVLESYYGPLPDIRGDGKMNILCFDFNAPTTLGFTSVQDLYEEIRVGTQLQRGDRLPIVHVSTAPVLQDVSADVSLLFPIAVHEMQHTIFCARDYPEDFVLWTHYKTMMGEFLAVAAQELVYPGSGFRWYLPWWYNSAATQETLLSDDAPFYLRGTSKRQLGKSLFDRYNDTDDYGIVFLLAHFVENRGGADAFANIMARWSNGIVVTDFVRPIWEELGYEDYTPFMEDFLLSILLHEESGPYQLHPFVGYNPADWDGEEDPFARLVPMVAVDTPFSVGMGGYTVIRPVDDVYYPPDTASEGLRYVGIKMK